MTDNINPLRFDLSAKIIYAKYYLMNLNTTFHIDLYKEHIKIFNNGIELTNPHSDIQSIKNNVDDFIVQFNKLIDNMKVNGFDNRYPVVFGRNNIILDGIHRLAISIVLNIEPCQIIKQIKGTPYDYSFFRNRNKERYSSSFFDTIVCDTMALEFVKLLNNTFVLTQFPITKSEKQFEIENIINEHKGRIFYKKEILFNEIGFRNLMHELYRGEKWIGGLFPNNNCGGKYERCFNKDKSTIFYFFTCNNIKNVLLIKEKIRQLFNLEKHSVHINDTHEESLRISKSILNDNTIIFMNNCDLNLNETTKIELTKYFDEVKKYDIDKFCIDSSLILEFYNLRKANDIDYISYDDIKLKKANAHLRQPEYLKYYNTSKDDILFNPINYFYLNGYKFTTLKTVYLMKKNRNEKKDIIDCSLIEEKYNLLIQ